MKIKKRIIPSLMIAIFLISLVSAEIIISEQPKDIYNLGDTISIPVKIKSLTNTFGIFQMNLICSGKEINFYKNGISLTAGEEKSIDSALPLIKEIIEDSSGICKIKSTLLKDYVLTNEFKISNLIDVKANANKNNFNPGEEISITGNATKESGSEVTGFVEITFLKEGSVKITQIESITKSSFSSKIIIPSTMEAGEYTVSFNAYEKDSQEKVTNKGNANYEIEVNQIPTSLEIFFEQKEVNPGENAKVKAILHDQTGGKIDASAIITIKNQKNTILMQTEKQTDSFIEYPIKEQEPPSELKVVALSNQITSEASFKIKEQEKINIEIINRTVTITNTGNVFYNKAVLIEIGDSPFSINTSLEVGEATKYTLTAPNGEYQVKVLLPEGGEVVKSVMLTGDVISVEEFSEGAMNVVRHPFTWVFVAAILGVIAFFFFKKNHRKKFLGYAPSKEQRIIPPVEKTSSQKGVLISSKNKAHLSLSINGTQQKASAVCIKIKNYSEVLSNQNNVKETLQKIDDMAENAKAFVYENREFIFFIFAPLMTKTFQSELTAADLAQSAKKILESHNKIFKQKINYGISAEQGEIIIKQVGETISFAGLGSFMINTKKLASISNGEAAIGEKLKEKIQSDAKLEKHASERMHYYTIKEIKDKEKHKSFINSFMKRHGKDTKTDSIKREEPKDIPKKEVEDEDFDLESL